MKAFLALVTLFVSSQVMAHTCHISLFDNYNRPVLNFHTQNDLNCQSAANSCYATIRNNNYNPNYFKCYTMSMTEDRYLPPRQIPVPQQYTSSPRQEVNPNAIAAGDDEYLRNIDSGEAVIYQDKVYIVTGINGDLYDLKLESGKKKDVVKDVPRNAIALRRACLREICTKTSVISKNTRSSLAVAGISTNGTYVLLDVAANKYISNVNYSDLVKSKGCAKDMNVEACVGNQVMGQGNEYFEVVGILSQQYVVLKDKKQKLYFDVLVRSLIVTR